MNRSIAWTALVVLGFLICAGSVFAEVIVYTSVDEILSSRIFETIEKRTGLDIRPVYDTEATKTTGLYLRILQEHPNTRADVFWNSEFSRTLLLQKEGLLDSYQSPSAESIPERFRDPISEWTGFSARARVLCYNTDLVESSEAPMEARGLLDPKWKGKVAWANPMFGTTATHCGALLALLGEPGYRQLMQGFDHQVVRLPGNGQVADLVARGRFELGLTDTDDVWRLKLEGQPIEMVPYDQAGRGTLLIPNTVAILKGAPHPEDARQFVDALLRPEIEEFIANSTSRQWPVRSEVPRPEGLGGLDEVKSIGLTYREVADSVDQALEIAREIVLTQ
ncbi:MAG: extracellular solute-binding protein [Candidatus Omnitrophica bacterium]|nr:extracellular solute-binding protein [Candidatus Omnitrophota bacterium]